MENVKLSRKLFVWLVFIALSPTFVLSVLYLNSFENAFSLQEKKQFTHLADKKTSQINDYFNERFTDANLISKTETTARAFDALLPGDKALDKNTPKYVFEIKKLQQSFLPFKTPDYLDIYLLSLHGDILSNLSHPDDISTNIHATLYQHPHLRQAFKKTATSHDVVMSNYHVHPKTAQISAFITAPVFREKQLLGVIALQINNKKIQQIINDKNGISSRKTSIIALQGDSFSYQASSNSTLTNIGVDGLTTSLSATIQHNLTLSTQESSALHQHSNDLISISRPIQPMNWLLILEEDFNEAMQPVNQLTKLGIGILIALLFSVITLAMYFGKSVAQPIVSMTRVTRAIAEGDFKLKVEPIGFKESVELANAINKMSTQVEKAKTSLELDVAKRTHELQEISGRLQKITARVPGMVYQFELRANGEMSFPYVSGSIKDIYRIEPEELQDDCTKAFSVIHPDDMESVYASINESANTMLPWCKEYRIFDTDGSIRWLLGNSNPEHTADGGVLWHGFVTDISERKNMEEQLRRSQKMEALGKLTSGIAHDYNNMLGIILGYADLLALQLKDQPKLENYVTEIHKASERGAKLTQKLLAFSRQKSSNPAISNVNHILLDSQNMLEKILTARIKLSLTLADNLWPVWLDKNELEDTILNIAINAMHAMAEYGQLTLETENISIDTAAGSQLNIPPGNYVSLSIKDTGCGMEKQVLERIFDPFYSTKGERGTGLGLSQVYGFIERSGSIIKVNSTPNEGSEFKLYFSQYGGGEPQQIPDVINQKTNNLSGKENILIVDDEVVLLNICDEILTQKGYQTFCTQSAKEALIILEKESIDLLLSDVIMPEMGGYELASIVRKKHPNVKIQLMSGFSDERNKRYIDTHLSENILHKPYTLNDLLLHVKKLLHS